MLDVLLALFEEDEEEFLFADCKRLAFDDERITIDLEVGSESWKIVCDRVLESAGTLGGSDIDLRESDPLLMPYHDERGSLSFRGVPMDVDAVIGAMWLAHTRHFGDCFPFRKFLNHYPLDELLSGGFGQLAQGPLTLIREYEAALQRNGVDTHVHVWNPNPISNMNAKLLVVGNGFVIAENFSATRV